jgi:hypothetical protein
MVGSWLYIATIGTDGTGRTRLVKSLSREFRLHGRDQVALTTFTSFVLDFLEAKKISSLTLVASPRAGTHMAGADTYKVEAALQLLPLRVALVPSTAITQFGRKADGIPGPDCSRLGKQAAKLQSRAITAAAYAASKPVAVVEQFSQGSIHAEVQKQSTMRKGIGWEARLREQLAAATTYEERATALVMSLGR